MRTSTAPSLIALLVSSLSAPLFAQAPPPALVQPVAARATFHPLTALNRKAGGGFFVSRVGTVLRNHHTIDNVAAALNAVVDLGPGKDVFISITPCGEENAWYDPATGNITLCDELFEQTEHLFAHMGAGPAFDDAVLGATQFFLLHEAGHAMVHRLRLPVLGGEEDAVDAIATVLSVALGAQGIAMSAANSFAFMAARRKPGSARTFWDVHSLDEQRYYNIACWIYGSNPKGYGFLVQSNLLPQKRAVGCPGEYVQKRAAVAATLGPHFVKR